MMEFRRHQRWCLDKRIQNSTPRAPKKCEVAIQNCTSRPVSPKNTASNKQCRLPKRKGTSYHNPLLQQKSISLTNIATKNRWLPKNNQIFSKPFSKKCLFWMLVSVTLRFCMVLSLALFDFHRLNSTLRTNRGLFFDFSRNRLSFGWVKIRWGAKIYFKRTSGWTSSQFVFLDFFFWNPRTFCIYKL